MPLVRALVAAALVLGVVAASGATAAHACSCRAIAPVERLATADVAFVGHTLQSPVGDPTGMSSTYDFVVDDALAGDPGPRVVIDSNDQQSACGMVFIARRRYLVFADRGPGGTLVTGSCSGTTRATAEALDRLGADEPPPPPPADVDEVAAPRPVLPSGPGTSGLAWLGWLTFGAGAIALAGAAFLGLRRVVR